MVIWPIPCKFECLFSSEGSMPFQAICLALREIETDMANKTTKMDFEQVSVSLRNNFFAVVCVTS